MKGRDFVFRRSVSDGPESIRCRNNWVWSRGVYGGPLRRQSEPERACFPGFRERWTAYVDLRRGELSRLKGRRHGPRDDGRLRGPGRAFRGRDAAREHREGGLLGAPLQIVGRG